MKNDEAEKILDDIEHAIIELEEIRQFIIMNLGETYYEIEN